MNSHVTHTVRSSARRPSPDGYAKSVEETLNALLDAAADRLCNAQRYERSEARRDTRPAITSVSCRPKLAILSRDGLAEMHVEFTMRGQPSVVRPRNSLFAHWANRNPLEGEG
jgi:hypothetical protein